jgi:hypothetical protein
LRIAAAVGTVLLAALAGTAAPARINDTDKGCNVRLKGLKTLSDPQRKLVNLHPKNTTLAAINALPQPHPTPKTRTTAFERQVWRVNVQITEFKLEGDSDIHLVMFGDGAYESPKCQPLSVWRRRPAAAKPSSPRARSSRPAAANRRTAGSSSVQSSRSVALASSTFHTHKGHTPRTSRNCIR